MNKKGFTLVEILSVIVLIALLLGIGIPGISRISNNMKKKSQNTKVNLIEQAGTLWGQANKTMLQTDTCNIDGVGDNIPCRKISVYGLIDEDYLDSEKKGELVFINSETDKSMLNDCVYVYKKNNRVYAKFKGVPSEGEECKPDVSEPIPDPVPEPDDGSNYELRFSDNEFVKEVNLNDSSSVLSKYKDSKDSYDTYEDFIGDCMALNICDSYQYTDISSINVYNNDEKVGYIEISDLETSEDWSYENMTWIYTYKAQGTMFDVDTHLPVTITNYEEIEPITLTVKLIDDASPMLIYKNELSPVSNTSDEIVSVIDGDCGDSFKSKYRLFDNYEGIIDLNNSYTYTTNEVDGYEDDKVKLYFYDSNTNKIEYQFYRYYTPTSGFMELGAVEMSDEELYQYLYDNCYFQYTGYGNANIDLIEWNYPGYGTNTLEASCKVQVYDLNNNPIDGCYSVASAIFHNSGAGCFSNPDC